MNILKITATVVGAALIASAAAYGASPLATAALILAICIGVAILIPTQPSKAESTSGSTHSTSAFAGRPNCEMPEEPGMQPIPFHEGERLVYDHEPRQKLVETWYVHLDGHAHPMSFRLEHEARFFARSHPGAVLEVTRLIEVTYGATYRVETGATR